MKHVWKWIAIAAAAIGGVVLLCITFGRYRVGPWIKDPVIRLAREHARKARENAEREAREAESAARASVARRMAEIDEEVLVADGSLSDADVIDLCSRDGKG